MSRRIWRRIALDGPWPARPPNPSGLNGVVAVSIGVALSPPCDLPELIAAADAALYDAKSQGRDKVRVAGSVADTAIS